MARSGMHEAMSRVDAEKLNGNEAFKWVPLIIQPKNPMSPRVRRRTAEGWAV
jgi:hypothetical protein